MSETDKNMDDVDAVDSESGRAAEIEPEAVPATPAETADDTSGDKHVSNLDFLLDVPLEITVELGRTTMVINDLLKLSQGSVVELSKAAGETLEIRANQKLIARGETVVVNDKYGIRLTEVISPIERLQRLK